MPLIRVEELTISKNQVSFRLSYPKKIQKYFLSNRFYVEYDKDVQDVSSSILYIPVISSIAPLAWVTGANIYVEELDRTYLESLAKIKLVMKRWYPRLPFSSTIYVKNIVSNSFQNKNFGLMFTGGIDSTVSFIKHRSDKPHLIMVGEPEVPLRDKAFWRRIKNRYKTFAKEENVNIDFITMNYCDFLNEEQLERDFGRFLAEFVWWGALQHGILLLSLCAPLTVIENIGVVLIASSATKDYKIPWGSHPLIDNKLSWADIKIVHDCYELSRQEKIRHVLKNYLRDHIEKRKTYPYLKVCNSMKYIDRSTRNILFDRLENNNCSDCEKCIRTITGLTEENIDPNKCGFNIGDDFFNLAKGLLIKTKFKPIEAFIWRDIQRHIPKTITHDLYSSKAFFEWLKDFEIKESASMGIRKNLLRLYDKLPKNVRVKFNQMRKVHGLI